MGIISSILGLGSAIKPVAEVFIPNAEKDAQRAADRFSAAQEAYSKEFKGEGWFNRLVDALNRLPRPMLALGTIGLFVYAFYDPVGFSERMAALDLVPQELWWLLGAIVSFYFGARELHKSRQAKPVQAVVKNVQEIRKLRDHLTPMTASDSTADAAIEVAGPLIASDHNQAIEDFFRN